ncbi:hypothetical protein [Blastochloris tepida]|nr:hypothetical protein [Blastochloris tepida]
MSRDVRAAIAGFAAAISTGVAQAHATTRSIEPGQAGHDHSEWVRR